MQPIKYERGRLELLNQKLLPQEVVFEDCSTVEKTFVAIRDMKVRGAPAIAISALLGLAAEAFHPLVALRGGGSAPGYSGAAEAVMTLSTKLDYLQQSRPTAVNLANAVADCKTHLAKALPAAADGVYVIDAYLTFAEAYLAEDVEINKGIGRFGADFILERYSHGASKIRMLTHCNTGALATTQYGTALGVVRFVYERAALERVFCTETRPYNQGARLTAFECSTDGLPTTLLVDSAVSYLMQTHALHAVVVGADRVCNNGDTANKIGTYQIALAAKHHGVPFFVCVPTTTLDLSLLDGSGIHIEERPSDEITHNPLTGARVVVDSPNLSVWNPSFDVTPAALITGIITERGVIEPDASGAFNITAWLAKPTTLELPAKWESDDR